MGRWSRAGTWAVVAAAAAGIGAEGAAASFAPQAGSPYAVGSGPLALALSDLTGDGRVDVATANGNASTLSVLAGSAFGPLPGSPYPTADGPNDVAVADFNGDGRRDVAVSAYVGNATTILLAAPGGGFVAEPPVVTPRATSVVAADFSGDGVPDLAVNDADADLLRVFARQPGSFAAFGAPIPTGDEPRALAAADLSGDGRPDLAATLAGAAPGVQTFVRQAAPTGFAADPGGPVPVGALPYGIVAAELGGDARPDLAVTSFTAGTLTPLVRQPAGTFAAGTPLAVGLEPVGVAAGDADGDGLDDLAVAISGADAVTVLLRRGGGFVADPSAPMTVPDAPQDVAFGDADADGRLDLAVASAAADRVSVLLNTTPRPPATGGGGGGAPATTPSAPAVLPPLPGTRPPRLSRRITGSVRVARRRARFRWLRVAPVRAGDTIRLVCRGRGCPFRSRSLRVRRSAARLSLTARVRSLRLRSGASLEVRVTRPGFTGVARRWTARGRRAPRSATLCLPPGAGRPQRC